MIIVGPRRNVCGRVVREQCKVRIVGTCEVPAWNEAWDPVKGYGVPGERESSGEKNNVVCWLSHGMGNVACWTILRHVSFFLL